MCCIACTAHVFGACPCTHANTRKCTCTLNTYKHHHSQVYELLNLTPDAAKHVEHNGCVDILRPAVVHIRSRQQGKGVVAVSPRYVCLCAVVFICALQAQPEGTRAFACTLVQTRTQLCCVLWAHTCMLLTSRFVCAHAYHPTNRYAAQVSMKLSCFWALPPVGRPSIRGILNSLDMRDSLAAAGLPLGQVRGGLAMGELLCSEINRSDLSQHAAELSVRWPCLF